MIGPILEKAAAAPENEKEISFVKVNVDEAQELATEFKVTALPTVSSFKNGKLKESFMGARDAKFIDKFIKESF